jgi:hypothetical protein
MGQAKHKRRDCPAVGRVIDAAECGANRASRYQCPAECPFNPWSPALYERSGEIEDAVTSKLFNRMRDEGVDLADIFPSYHGNNVGLQRFIVTKAYRERDGAGRTLVERWERDGWKGLSNDERVFLRHISRMRLGLIEVHRVIDEQRCEAVDLFADATTPFVIQDFSLASAATRFYQALAWTFEMPHYRRIHGVALSLPDVNGFDALGIVREVAAHLGGPTDGEALRGWLEENIEQVDKAAREISKAMQRAMIENTDAKFFKTTYRLRGSPKEVLRRLDALPSVEVDELADDEKKEGFHASRDWFDEPSPLEKGQTALPLAWAQPPPLGRPSLGRVLVAAERVRIETTTTARYEALRARFEKTMGALVQFSEERVDDLGSQMLRKNPPADLKLVPPRLLQNAPRLILQSSRIVPPPHLRSKEETEQWVVRQQHERFLDNAIPLLGGLTPRQAATDSAQRPKLLQLIKTVIRREDEKILRGERGEDLNWMARELGLTEIIFDPPPSRPPLPPEEDDVLGDNSDDPPFTTPSGVMSQDEVIRRLEWVRDEFPDVDEMMDLFEEEAPDFYDTLEGATLKRFNDDEWTWLLILTAEAWFVFFAKNPPEEAFKSLRFLTSLQTELKHLDQAIESKAPDPIDDAFNASRQPALVRVLLALLVSDKIEASKKNSIRDENISYAAILLKVVVDEMDRMAEESNARGGWTL